MTPNDTAAWCATCHKALEVNEGRVLWDSGFYRTFCFPHASELLEARRARRKKKVANAQLKLKF